MALFEMAADVQSRALLRALCRWLEAVSGLAQERATALSGVFHATSAALSSRALAAWQECCQNSAQRSASTEKFLRGRATRWLLVRVVHSLRRAASLLGAARKMDIRREVRLSGRMIRFVSSKCCHMSVDFLGHLHKMFTQRFRYFRQSHKLQRAAAFSGAC